MAGIRPNHIPRFQESYRPVSARSIEARDTAAAVAAEEGSRRLLAAYLEYFARHHPDTNPRRQGLAQCEGAGR